MVALARSGGVWLLLVARVALAHDVGADLNGAFTTGSEVNPRSGSLGLGLTGAWDLTPEWSLFGLATYTRDLATRTRTTSSEGGNIFRLSLGAQWLPHPQWMVMLALSGSPPAPQSNTTTRVVTEPLTGDVRTFDVIIDSRSNALGAQLFAGWMSEGLGAVQSTLDVGAGVNRYDIFQRLRLGDGPGADFVRRVCERRASEVCALVQGANTPLWQGRFSASYTATFFHDTDVGAELGLYLYDRDPAEVGYFSVVVPGRQDLGSGVPVSPLLFTVRSWVAHRFTSLSLRLGYQFGLYASGLGTMHAVTTRATWKVTDAWRLSTTVTVQLDPGVSWGGVLVLGVLRVF